MFHSTHDTFRPPTRKAQTTQQGMNFPFCRYEELCTLCYQHTLDPGAVAVKRAATEIGGGGPPSRSSYDRNAKHGHRREGSEGVGDDGLGSPPSSAGGRSTGGGSGVFGGSFSSLNSPTHGRESSTGSGIFGRGRGSPGSSTGGGGGDGGSGWSSPKGGGGGGSPMNRGKQFFAKHLRK